MGTVFPEAFRDFLNAIPAGERDDPLRAYRHRLTDPDPAVHMPAARAWSRYESACSTLRPTGPVSRLGGGRLGGDRAALAIARIEAHYFANEMFLRENQLLDGLNRIRHLPAAIRSKSTRLNSSH